MGKDRILRRERVLLGSQKDFTKNWKIIFAQRRLRKDEILTFAMLTQNDTTHNVVAIISYVIAKEQSDCGNLKQRDRRFPRLARKPLNDTTHNVVAIISYVIALCTFCESKGVKRRGNLKQRDRRFSRLQVASE